MLKGPLALNEPCYTLSGVATAEGAITVSPGTTIVFGEGALLSLELNSSFEAIGTAEKPIVLRGRETTPGYWNGLSFSSHSSHNRLSHVTIEGAGLKGKDAAAVLLASGAQLAIDHSTVRNAAGSGILLYDHASFSHFEANHFEAIDFPLTIKASDAAMIDPETTFSNNKHNVVFIQPRDGRIEEDSLWRSLPVPYEIGNSLDLAAHLTLEPGAKLQFEEGGSIDVTLHGSLTAIGTAEKPIILTGTEESPGFWSGINFEVSSAQNVLRNVDLRFAGARSGPTASCVGVWAAGSATVQASRFTGCPVAILVQRGGTLNADADSSNTFAGSHKTVVRE